jgi:hypothetical protein
VSRRATGEQAPDGDARHDDPVLGRRLDHGGDHGDGDDEVAPRTELEEPSARPIAGFAMRIATTISSTPQVVCR